MRARPIAEWTFQAALAALAWLAFTQRVSPGELAFGAAAAVVAGSASQLVWSRNGATFAGELRALAQVVRLPRYAISGTWEILATLARHLAGRPAPSLLLWVRYDAGPEGPRAQARRALAVAYTTMTPNFVVLGIDRERGRLWYHQVRRGAIPRMTVALGARP